MSHRGVIDLKRREKVIEHYYDDPVRNCTYGVGTLAHLGRCSPEELHTKVSQKLIVLSLQHGIHVAEAAIHRHVKHQRLNQDQFDALVSFTYNVGPGGAHHVLKEVDKGHLRHAGQIMMRFVKATVYGKDGRKKKRVTLPGLITRREEESKPFLSSRGHK